MVDEVVCRPGGMVGIGAAWVAQCRFSMYIFLVSLYLIREGSFKIRKQRDYRMKMDHND